jgi:hypothetical protein
MRGGNRAPTLYTKTAIEGTATFDASAFAGSATWPLKAGTYEIRHLVDDSYRSIAASANFKVVKRQARTP